VSRSKDTPRSRNSAKKTVGYVLGAATLIAAVGLMIDSKIPAIQPRLLHTFHRLERTMNLVFLLFLLLIAIFMTWFPVRLKRNAAVYLGVYFFYFVAREVGLVWINVMGNPRIPGIWMLSVWVLAAACLMTMNRRGELRMAVLGHAWNPGRMTALSAQLDAMNAAVERAGKRIT